MMQNLNRKHKTRLTWTQEMVSTRVIGIKERGEMVKHTGNYGEFN